jgi:hypothetical protein
MCAMEVTAPALAAAIVQTRMSRDDAHAWLRDLGASRQVLHHRVKPRRLGHRYLLRAVHLQDEAVGEEVHAEVQQERERGEPDERRLSDQRADRDQEDRQSGQKCESLDLLLHDSAPLSERNVGSRSAKVQSNLWNGFFGKVERYGSSQAAA